MASKNSSRFSKALKKSLATMILPAAGVILLANLFIPGPDGDDPSAVIRSAVACDNYAVANEEYKKLIQADFFNVAYHRGYIRSHFRTRSVPEDAEDAEDGRDDLALIGEYLRYASDPDGRIADIGHYGLGFSRVERDYSADRCDLESAEAYYLKVKDKSLTYLNSSLGFVYAKLRDYERAKGHFREEIRHGGNLEGAYRSLAVLALKTKEYDELNTLVNDPEARAHVPAGIIRANCLAQGQYGRYLLRVFDLTYITSSGFLCALLILLAWFFYLRRLDVFEPEKYRYLLLTLLLGMAFSMLATPLHDFCRVFLGFDLTGERLNDLLFCILAIGVIEEAVKIVPVLIILKATDAINESIDFIIYASTSALGFAFMENLLFFNESGLTSVAGRGFAAVLLHMSLSSFVIYGLFYAIYRKGKGRYRYLAVSFAIACAVHGLYDFWLVAEGLRLLRLLSPLIFICVVYGYGRVVNTALHQSEFMPKNRVTLLNATSYLVYALTGIVLLEYVTLAWNFGPQNANHAFVLKMIMFYIVLLIITKNLGSFDILERRWIPLFGR